MLALVPYLNAHGSVHVDQAARDLAVPAAQIVKDLRVLFLCGLPGGYPDDLIDVDISALTEADGDRIIRMSNADYLARPLRLSPTEASALIVALRTLRDGSGLDEHTATSVDSALAKLESAMGADTTRISTGETSRRDAQVDTTWALVSTAIEHQHQVAITYHVPARDELVDRIVDPWELTRSGGAAYLEAWCHLAGDTRSFRLDRVHDAHELSSPIEHTAPDTERAASPDGVRATLRLAPVVRWFPDYYRTQAVRRLDDGSSEVDMAISDLRWLQRLVLRLAPHVDVIAPEGLMETITSRATETLGLYE